MRISKTGVGKKEIGKTRVEKWERPLHTNLSLPTLTKEHKLTKYQDNCITDIAYRRKQCVTSIVGSLISASVIHCISSQTLKLLRREAHRLPRDNKRD